MVKVDDERSPHESGVAGEKCRKRSFRSEIYEEPQSAYHVASKNVSCLNNHQGGISGMAGKSELEQTSKQMTFTRSEVQHFISLLHSMTSEESETLLLRLEASTRSGSLKKQKHGDERDNFNTSVVGSRVLEEEIASPAELATCLSITLVASPQHRAEATMENLPDELLSNIFTRLLAKQLAQMRSVSKSWNALLSQPSFIRSHLHRSIHNNDEILLVFHPSPENSVPFTTHSCRSPHLQDQLTNFIKLPVNPQSPHTGSIRVIGSVNGLICSSYNNDSVIQIWNPSLSAVLTLPPYSTPSSVDKPIKIHFGFGYDPKTDDYKVVKLTGLTGPSKHIIKWWLQVEIYSMREGRWHLITERFPSHITQISGERYVCTGGHNGYLHWLCVVGDKDDLDTIVGFDLGSETFREIPLPFSTRGHNDEKFVGVLGEKLCVMLYNEGDDYEVWVMEEYGVAESWVKHHVFSSSFKYTIPFGITSRGEFLVEAEDGCYTVLYDPLAKEQKLLDFCCPLKVVDYVDSLVWIAPVEHEIVDGGGQI